MNDKFNDAWAISVAFVVPIICGFFDTTPIIRILILLLSIAIVWAVLALRKHLRNSSNIRKVNWCRDSMNSEFINKISFKFVDKKYHLDNEQDEIYVKDLLSQVQHQMEQQFFRGTFPCRKELRKLSDEEFVMLYLHSYLANLNLKDDIAGLEPIKYSHKEDKYTTVYTLTDSGYAFYRLLHITEAYCENNEKIIKTGLCYLDSYNHTKELESGTYMSFG